MEKALFKYDAFERFSINNLSDFLNLWEKNLDQ